MKILGPEGVVTNPAPVILHQEEVTNQAPVILHRVQGAVHQNVTVVVAHGHTRINARQSGKRAKIAVARITLQINKDALPVEKLAQTATS